MIGYKPQQLMYFRPLFHPTFKLDPKRLSLAFRSYGQCYGPRLWLPQAQQLRWPTQLVAASLCDDVKPPKVAPSRRRPGSWARFTYPTVDGRNPTPLDM